MNSTYSWEQRKLGEIYKINNERNTGKIPADQTLSVASMTYKPGGNGSSDSSIPNYKVLRIGDAGFEGHSNKEYAHGRFVVNTKGLGIISPRFSAIRPIVELNPTFFKYFFSLEKVMGPILVRSTKLGTMMNELVHEDLFKQIVFVPVIHEQNEIGNFFMKLELLITLHHRQHLPLIPPVSLSLQILL